MDSSEERLHSLRAEQAILSRQLSFLTLGTIFIFGVPAVFGYFVGVYLENSGVTKMIAYTLPLALTFALSWTFLLKKLNHLKREVDGVESEIHRLAPPVASENKDEDLEKEDLK